MDIDLLRSSAKDTAKAAKIRTHLKSELDRRIQGSIPPNAELVLHVPRVGSLTNRIYLMALISWYLKDEVRIYIQMNLLDFDLKKLAPEDQIKVSVALHSKVAALQLIALRYSERDWFGNMIPLLKKILPGIHFSWRLPRRPKKLVRHRGYRDHGTLRPSDRWVAKSDYSLTDLQNKIEEDRKLFQDSIQILRGFLE